MSFLLPTARCDLHLSSSDMGLLTASIFLGESKLLKQTVVFQISGVVFISVYILKNNYLKKKNSFFSDLDSKLNVFLSG